MPIIPDWRDGDATSSGEESVDYPLLPIVRRADLGKRWPLTVDEVEVGCQTGGGALHAYTATVDGATYALNGMATTVSKMEARRWRPIRELLADPPPQGVPVDMSALTLAAEQTC